jgi:N-acetylmuramoyl-L-alanine amidase
MNDNFCVYLDAGHSGLDKAGKYLTPGKRFKHVKGVFHGNGYFYEGVWNRTLTNLVARKLSQLSIPHIIVSHDYLDTSLEERVDRANWYHRNYKSGIFISNHANASASHLARGFEVYTSRGRTKADPLADLHWNNVNELLGKPGTIQMRSDKSDGDLDREAGFYVLRQTVMPAMLVEHLFFDNYLDALLLMNDDVIDKFAEAQVRTIIEHMNS